MGVISWVIIGVIVGLIVSHIFKVHGRSRLFYIAASVAGSILGGINVAYLYKSPGAIDGINLSGMIFAGVGALLACAALRLFGTKRVPETEGRP